MDSKYNKLYSIVGIGLAVAVGLIITGNFAAASVASVIGFCLILMMDKIIGPGAEKRVQRNWILISGILSLVSIILLIIK
tara:strand:+ start:371 stop:610 length:240 start_codon:yes stop_codon:yes gene_type:complete